MQKDRKKGIPSNKPLIIRKDIKYLVGNSRDIRVGIDKISVSDPSSCLTYFGINEMNETPEKKGEADSKKAKKKLSDQSSSSLPQAKPDPLQQQLASCWKGTRYADNIAVEIRLLVKPDRTLKDAKVVNQARYNKDSVFRMVADSALRAVHSPNCSPLNLPEGNYEQWKEIIVTFDPRKML